MVDSVTFGAPRPVSGLNAHAIKRDLSASAVGNPAPPQSLSLASALARLGPPHDAEKVASLKAAIANGSYQIHLGKIADGMIRFSGSDLG